MVLMALTRGSRREEEDQRTHLTKSRRGSAISSWLTTIPRKRREMEWEILNWWSGLSNESSTARESSLDRRKSLLGSGRWGAQAVWPLGGWSRLVQMTV